MRVVTLLVCSICMLFAVSAAWAGTEVQKDTLQIEAVKITKGGSIGVKIDFVNSAELGALTIPLYVNGEGTKIDSISFAGGRLAYLRAKPVTIAEDRKKVVFGAICMTEDYIAPGRGLLATVYVTVPDPVKGNPVVIDTTTVHPATLLFTKSNSLSYAPLFISGSIGAALPAPADSTKN